MAVAASRGYINFETILNGQMFLLSTLFIGRKWSYLTLAKNNILSLIIQKDTEETRKLLIVTGMSWRCFQLP